MLTEREKQIMVLFPHGLCNMDNAERLAVNEKRVRNHITHAFAKLGVQTRAEWISKSSENLLPHRRMNTCD